MDTDPFTERLRQADLDRYLATLYAPAEARPALFALHALDLELADIVRTTSQSMIGLIRLAWWREALERLDKAPPPAQPLLVALAERVLPRGVSGADLATLEPGFAELFEDPPAIMAYADARGGALFEIAARLARMPTHGARAAGRVWASADLLRLKPGTSPDELRPCTEPLLLAAWRPLRGLALLARRDLEHGAGRPGSPSRQLHLLWSILRPG